MTILVLAAAVVVMWVVLDDDVVVASCCEYSRRVHQPQVSKEKRKRDMMLKLM
jgi:hypothetical protein